MTATPEACAPEAQTMFLSFLPEFQSRARMLLSDQDPEAREEGVQEMTAQAWNNYLGAVERERGETPTPYTLARYAHQNYRTGRRIAGTSSTDVLSEATMARHRTRLTRHDPHKDHDDPLHNVLVDKKKSSNPYHAFRLRHDWDLIRSKCTDRQRRVLEMLAEGERPGHIAEALGISPGRVTQIKDDIGKVIRSVGYGPRPALSGKSV